MAEYREIEFVPANWVERAAFWPGLQVHSRPICVPVDVPRRRKNDSGILTVDEIERLLRTVFPEEPFQSVDLDHVEELLTAYED